MDELKNKGQALIEYLILFSFMSLLGINMVKGMGGAMGVGVRTIGYGLTQQLSTGVCKELCFYNDYNNIGN